MKMCNDSDKCATCGAKEMCKALETLLTAIENYTPKPIPDYKIKHDAGKFLADMCFAMDEQHAMELYKQLDFKTFHGLILTSLDIISELYISWDAKNTEIEKLKVLVDAQEVINHD